MKNNLYNFLVQKELELLKWIAKNHFKVILFLSVSGILLFFSKLPYFNLIMRGSLKFILIVISVLFIFRVSIKNILFLSIFILVVSIFLLLINFSLGAIYIFDILFGIIFVMLVKLIGTNYEKFK